MKDLYEIKNQQYFGSARREILPLLPEKCGRLLDVGCGHGATVGWLKELGRVQEAWGVELIESAAASARETVDHLSVGDIEEGRISFEPSQFNVILCLDVLEHLRDPWRVTRRLVEWLDCGGVLIASLPNIRYYTVVRDLALLGRFEYEDMGLLDRTHLRFFTRGSAISLLRGCGLEQIELRLHPDSIKGKRRLFDIATMGRFRDMFSWQMLLRGQKPKG